MLMYFILIGIGLAAGLCGSLVGLGGGLSLSLHLRFYFQTCPLLI